MFAQPNRIPVRIAAPIAMLVLGICTFPGATQSNAQSRITVSVSPTTASVQANIGTQKFTATVRGDSRNRGVKWALTGTGCSGSTCGTLSATSSASGVAITYHGPSAAPNPAKVTLTATSVSNTSKKAAATITVTALVSVSVSPTTASVSVLANKSFTASVANDPANHGVTWALTQAGAACTSSCGTLSGQTATSATYTAPASVPANPTITLTATSVLDPSKKASAGITVTSSTGTVSVTISPKRGGLAIGQTLAVSATVTNDVGSAGVSWSASGTGCSGATCGAFTNVTKTSATYTAPSAPGSYSITATSVASPGTNASAIVGVTNLSGMTRRRDARAKDAIASARRRIAPTASCTPWPATDPASRKRQEPCSLRTPAGSDAASKRGRTIFAPTLSNSLQRHLRPDNRTVQASRD